MHTFPAQVEQGSVPFLCFSSMVCLMPHFHIFVLSFLLGKVGPQAGSGPTLILKHSANELLMLLCTAKVKARRIPSSLAARATQLSTLVKCCLKIKHHKWGRSSRGPTHSLKDDWQLRVSREGMSLSSMMRPLVNCPWPSKEPHPCSCGKH